MSRRGLLEDRMFGGSEGPRRTTVEGRNFATATPGACLPFPLPPHFNDGPAAVPDPGRTPAAGRAIIEMGGRGGGRRWGLWRCCEISSVTCLNMAPKSWSNFCSAWAFAPGPAWGPGFSGVVPPACASYGPRACGSPVLQRTVAILPGACVNKSVGGMPGRCGLLREGKGGPFEGGGRSRQARRPS